MKKTNGLNWQLPYKENISGLSRLAGIEPKDKFSELEAQKILIQVVEEYKNGKLPLNELAMTCEILSSMCPQNSDLYWELVHAAEIEWYSSHEPEKVEEFLDSLMHYYEEIKSSSSHSE